MDRPDPLRDPAAVARSAADPAAFALASTTPSRWAAGLAGHLSVLLLEQAHLEKKAAAAAVQFLFRVPPRAELQRALSQLAREELLHFERVLRLLQRRGIAFDRQPPSAYAGQLKAVCRQAMPDRLVDELLVAALVEARSCDRMQCLAAALAEHDPDAAEFYRDLVAAEARHHLVYVEAAAALVPQPVVASRWRELARHEAAVLAAQPLVPRLHAGLVPAASLVCPTAAADG